MKKTVVGDNSESFSIMQDTFRGAGDIAKRAIALSAVVAVSTGEDQRFVEDWLYNTGLWRELTPIEMKFVSSANPTRQQLVNASWQYHALQVLLWTLGLVKEITDTEEQSSLSDGFQLLIPPNCRQCVEEFVSNARCRSDNEIREMYDKIWKDHWSARNEERNNLPTTNLHQLGVIEQRHRAILWILNSQDEPWDEIALHT